MANGGKVCEARASKSGLGKSSVRLDEESEVAREAARCTFSSSASKLANLMRIPECLNSSHSSSEDLGPVFVYLKDLSIVIRKNTELETKMQLRSTNFTQCFHQYTDCSSKYARALRLRAHEQNFSPSLGIRDGSFIRTSLSSNNASIAENIYA